MSPCGVHYLGERHSNRLNGMIDTLCKLMDVVPASVAEAEYGTAFTNAKMGTETRHTLEDLGFPQPYRLHAMPRAHVPQ